jgi:ADP-ribose pyrophosphatase YjhB (NUDIX family)
MSQFLPEKYKVNKMQQKRKMKKYPTVAVSIIFRYKNKILMLKHKNGKFTLPGGRMEWKESVLGALDRELKEELNYSLERLGGEPELFNVWNYISKNGRRHNVYIQYIYQLNKKPYFSSPEGLQPLWFTKKELISMKIITDEKFLNKVFNWKKSKNFKNKKGSI